MKERVQISVSTAVKKVILEFDHPEWENKIIVAFSPFDAMQFTNVITEAVLKATANVVPIKKDG